MEERKYVHGSFCILKSAFYSRNLKTFYIFNNVNSLTTAAFRKGHGSIFIANHKTRWQFKAIRKAGTFLLTRIHTETRPLNVLAGIALLTLGLKGSTQWQRASENFGWGCATLPDLFRVGYSGASQNIPQHPKSINLCFTLHQSRSPTLVADDLIQPKCVTATPQYSHSIWAIVVSFLKCDLGGGR